MTNYGKHILPLFEDDILTIKEYLRIAINIIFYHRWIGCNNYTQVKSNINNISYMKLSIESLENEIEKYISSIENYSNDSNKLQVTLNFYTSKISRFFIMEKLVDLWEKWDFLFLISKEGSKISEKEKKIRKFIFIILKELNNEKDFMPDLNFNVELPEETFPYEIKIETDLDNENIISLFKNMTINEKIFDN